MGPIITEAIKNHPQIPDPGRRGDSGIQILWPVRRMASVFFRCQGKAGFLEPGSNPRQHGSHLQPDLREVPTRKQKGEVVGVRYRPPRPAHIQLGEESIVHGVPQKCPPLVQAIA